MKAGWKVKRLGEVSDLVSTGPFGSLLHKSDYAATGVPVINPVDIVDGKIRHSSAKRVTDETASRLSSYRMLPGDIVVARRGDLGRCATIADHQKGWLCGTGSFFVRPSSAVLPEYIARFIASPPARKLFDSASTGTTMPNISNKTLADLPVPLPPLEEQRRIVAILDEAFDGLSRARANTEANLKSARELLDSAIGHVFAGAADWPTPEIAHIGEVFDGPHATPKTIDEGPLFLGISSLVDGRIELTKTRHVSEDDFAKWTRRVTPKGGDVVFSYETRLGQVGLIPEGMRCCLGRRMGLIRLKADLIDPEYFVLCYLSPLFQNFLQSKTIQGATVDRLSIKDFPRFPFPTPARRQQAEIVAQIHAIRDSYDRLLEAVESKLEQVEHLRQSILQKAFAGELTVKEFA